MTTKLSLTARYLLTYIRFKTNNNRPFFAGNDTIAKVIGCTESSTKVSQYYRMECVANGRIERHSNNILRAKAAKSYEPTQTIEKQGIQANDNENLQMGYMNFYEPQISDKNQEVTLKNATSLQIGDPNGTRTHIATVKG